MAWKSPYKWKPKCSIWEIFKLKKLSKLVLNVFVGAPDPDMQVSHYQLRIWVRDFRIKAAGHVDQWTPIPAGPPTELPVLWQWTGRYFEHCCLYYFSVYRITLFNTQYNTLVNSRLCVYDIQRHHMWMYGWESLMLLLHKPNRHEYKKAMGWHAIMV